MYACTLPGLETAVVNATCSTDPAPVALPGDDVEQVLEGRFAFISSEVATEADAIATALWTAKSLEGWRVRHPEWDNTRLYTGKVVAWQPQEFSGNNVNEAVLRIAIETQATGVNPP